MREDSYGELLQGLAGAHPWVTEVLRDAHDGRIARLPAYLRGERLDALEELLAYLRETELSFARAEQLRALTFLVSRLRGDFEIALEATLSGYFTVTWDAMRDTLEVGLLLKDFAHDTRRLHEWLAADEDGRKRRFKPVLLRERRAASLRVPRTDLPEEAEYAAHSRILHVGPDLLSGKGQQGAQAAELAQICFGDLLQHGRDVAVALHELQGALVPDPAGKTGIDERLPHLMRSVEAARHSQAVARSVEIAIAKRFAADGIEAGVRVLENGTVLVDRPDPRTLELYAIEGGLDLERVASEVAQTGSFPLELRLLTTLEPWEAGASK